MTQRDTNLCRGCGGRGLVHWHPGWDNGYEACPHCASAAPASTQAEPRPQDLPEFDASAGAVMDRLKEKLDLLRDADLARYLGVDRSSVAQWRRRDSVPYELVIETCAKSALDLDWILVGRPSPWTQGRVGA